MRYSVACFEIPVFVPIEQPTDLNHLSPCMGVFNWQMCTVKYIHTFSWAVSAIYAGGEKTTQTTLAVTFVTLNPPTHSFCSTLDITTSWKRDTHMGINDSNQLAVQLAQTSTLFWDFKTCYTISHFSSTRFASIIGIISQFGKIIWITWKYLWNIYEVVQGAPIWPNTLSCGSTYNIASFLRNVETLTILDGDDNLEGFSDEFGKFW